MEQRRTTRERAATAWTYSRLFALLATFQACASRPPAAPAGEVLPATASAPSAGASQPTQPATLDQREDLLLVTDHVVLRTLEKNGYGLGELLDGAAANDNEALARSPGYASIARVLELDIARAAQGDPLAGTSVARHAHRLFNAKWLRSKALHFELIGVANRLDRRPFHPNGCGETRLVYRLAYAIDRNGVALASRLPLTIGLEFPLAVDERGGCVGRATRWRPAKGLAKDALAAWLAGAEGPLQNTTHGEHRDLQVVTNLQVVRWPATMRPDLAGHAEYVLRAFRRGRKLDFEPAPLENSPDVERLEQQPARRRELLAWIRDPKNLAKIDEGTALVPQQFLTLKDLSVTPRGFGRRANRPYRRLFRAADFADLDLGKRRYARSPEALLRRLDDLTCVGCHQARTIAGFHLLGSDDPSTPALNSLREPVSIHVSQDIERRNRVLSELAAGREPDYARPFAERTKASEGGYGAHCGLGDAGFAEWTCDAGLRCDAYDAAAGDVTVGVCLPVEGGHVGDPCEVGALSPNDHPHRDRVSRPVERDCRESGCNDNRVGFPGGMCSAQCSRLPAEAACGAIAKLDPFNACIARREPFTRCIEQNHSPAALRRCDAGLPCRDDYICGRAATGDGVCIPPYFVFQLRVDGHPL